MFQRGDRELSLPLPSPLAFEWSSAHHNSRGISHFCWSVPSPTALAFSAALGRSPCYRCFFSINGQNGLSSVCSSWTCWLLRLIRIHLLRVRVLGTWGVSYVIYLVAALLLGVLIWKGRNLQARHRHRNSAVLGSVRCVCRVQVDFYG